MSILDDFTDLTSIGAAPVRHDFISLARPDQKSLAELLFSVTHPPTGARAASQVRNVSFLRILTLTQQARQRLFASSQQERDLFNHFAVNLVEQLFKAFVRGSDDGPAPHREFNEMKSVISFFMKKVSDLTQLRFIIDVVSILFREYSKLVTIKASAQQILDDLMSLDVVKTISSTLMPKQKQNKDKEVV